MLLIARYLLPITGYCDRTYIYVCFSPSPSCDPAGSLDTLISDTVLSDLVQTVLLVQTHCPSGHGHRSSVRGYDYIPQCLRLSDIL